MSALNDFPVPPLMKPAEAAAVLAVDVRTLRRWGLEGRVGAVTLPSGHHRYRRAEIEAIANGANNPNTTPTGDQR